MEVASDKSFSVQAWDELRRRNTLDGATFAKYALLFADPSLLPVVCQGDSAMAAFYMAFDHVVRAANAGDEFDVEVRPAFVKGPTIAEQFSHGREFEWAVLSVGPRLEKDEARYELLEELIKLALARA